MASGVGVNTRRAVGLIGIASVALGGVGNSFSESAEIFPFCVELAASKAVPAEIGTATALASCGVAVAACNSLTNMFAAVAAIIGFALSGGALTVTGIVAAGTDVIVTTASASPP